MTRPIATPFHAGERAAQARAGVGDMTARVGGFIRDYLPRQHRDFHTSLPFLVVAAADETGQAWVTIVEGPDGFVTSPDARTLNIAARLGPEEPLGTALMAGVDIGVLGIEPATRRRNRLTGRTRPHGEGFAIDVRQTFGNCPQYIRERQWSRVAEAPAPAALKTAHLTGDQIARIGAADTLFIGSGQRAQAEHPSNGYDASHRGGEPGFVRVLSDTRLRIPDYAGNNFFNTIGNLLENPRIGLLFVDFETGGLLQITGRAAIDWTPAPDDDPGARRVIAVTVEAVIDRPGALTLRWQADNVPTRDLVVTGKVAESRDITSFYLDSADGRPLAPFKAGQYLPVLLTIPGHRSKVARSYSLSGAPGDPGYRLSIRRDSRGLASGFMHDAVAVGTVIQAGNPSGAFLLPRGQCPLVLASAGVGITPMLAMLHTLASQHNRRPVWFIHGARDRAHHALGDEVERIAGSNRNVLTRILYSRPGADDRLGRDYDEAGRVTAKTLLNLKAGSDAHYMLCGPTRFLADIQQGLSAAGVPTDQIHVDVFGPAG